MYIFEEVNVLVNSVESKPWRETITQKKRSYGPRKGPETLPLLNHCGLGMLYGNIEMGQHWLIQKEFHNFNLPGANEQSGTKPNLVAKILATNFGVFVVIYVMFSKICSMWV